MEKYKPLREELENRRNLKTTGIPVVIEAFGGMTPSHENNTRQQSIALRVFNLEWLRS